MSFTSDRSWGHWSRQVSQAQLQKSSRTTRPRKSLSLSFTPCWATPSISGAVAPCANGYGESFNGKLRDELLNGEIFESLKEAKVMRRSASSP